MASKRENPTRFEYEWTEDKSGRLSMAADVTSFGRDPKAAKTVIAYLIPDREVMAPNTFTFFPDARLPKTGKAPLTPKKKDARTKAWYLTDIAPGVPDDGHSCVDVRNAAEGKAFLEKWATEIAMPELQQRQAELLKTQSRKLDEAPKSREDKVLEKAREAEKHKRERGKNKGRHR